MVQKKNNPCPPSLHHPEEEEDSPATPTPCAKKDHCRRTPETLTKLGKNTAACLLLRYVTEGQKNKTLIYRTTHIITSKLHAEEMSIG